MVTVRIFLYGLLLFDLTRCNQTPHKVHVVLAEAADPPAAVDGCRIQPHEPVLFYAVDDPAQCDDDCVIDHGLCRCEMSRQTLTLDGAIEAGYCPNLKDNFVVDVKYATGQESNPLADGCDGPTADKPCRQMIADMLLSVTQAVHVCAVETARDENKKEKPALFDLVKLTPRAVAEGTHQRIAAAPQRLARVLMLTAKVTAVEGARAVTVSLNAISGGETVKIDVPIISCDGGSPRCADLAVANLMYGAHPGGQCADPHLARHFTLYDVLLKDPKPADFKVPQYTKPDDDPFMPDDECSKSTLFKIFSSLSLVRSGTHLTICPMAVTQQ